MNLEHFVVHYNICFQKNIVHTRNIHIKIISNIYYIIVPLNSG